MKTVIYVGPGVEAFKRDYASGEQLELEVGGWTYESATGDDAEERIIEAIDELLTSLNLAKAAFEARILKRHS